MRLNDPDTVALPEDGTYAIPELPIYCGHQCPQCSFRTRTHDNYIRHRRLANHPAGHGTQSIQVQLQSWCKGRYTRYWIVGGGERHDTGFVAPSQLDAVLDQAQTELAAEDAVWLRKGDVAEGIDRDSPWVKRVGWAHHFGPSRDLTAIAKAAQWIRAKGEQARRRGWQDKEDEAAQQAQRRIVQLGTSFCREVERCCFRLDSVPVRTRQLLNNIEPGKVVGVPFQRKAHEASMDKYKLVGQRFLMFCYRAYQLGRKEAETQWAVRWTDEQWSLFQDVVNELERLEAGGQDGGGESYDNNEGNDNKATWTFSPAATPDGDNNAATQALDRACFQFLVACIRVRVGGNVYTNPLLCFCAAIGIQQQPLGFCEPLGYTGHLAAMLWWSRVLFLEAVFKDEPFNLDALSYPALARFDEEHAQWLCSGTHSVVDVLLEWLAYGKGYRKQALGRATMRWSTDRAVLFQNGEAIRVRDMQQTLCGLVRQTEQQLDGLLGGTWARASGGLALDRIQDSMLRLGAGQSFATQAANAWLMPGPTKVLDAMQDQLWNARDGQWRANAVRQWLRQLSQFRQQMLVSVHTWGGQPGRGPEVMTIRYCDTWQVQRNVYVDNGQVMLVTDRDKMKAMRDIGRKVARFLPDKIGRMLLAYILWLLPAERLLRRQCTLPLPADKDLAYLWRDGNTGAWDSSRLSAALGRVFQAGVGVAIGVMRYRQVAIEMGRQIKGLVVRQHDAAAADEADDGDEGLEVDPATGEAVAMDGGWNVVWDLQATHGTRIARQHYGVHVAFLGNLQPEMVETYRAISALWHQFLEKGYETEEAGAGRRPQRRKQGATIPTTTPNTMSSTISNNTLYRTRQALPALPRRTAKPGDGRRVAYSDITRGLQTLFGPSAAWRTVKQEECMRTIFGLGQGRSAICVLPTGAGKSILFLLAAVLPQTGTSIVVVPFVALLHDLVQRAQDMGVDCIAFQSGPAAAERVQRAARLVVVSADVVAGEAFCAYADGLVATGLLQRIFIDECHTVMTDVGYRARLGELRSLHRFGRALVLLTATLPPSLEPWLRHAMLAEDAVVVRDRTTKHNVQYRVDVVGPGPAVRERVLQRAVEVARELGAGMGAGQKGVLYCRSREQCEAVAEAMGCAAHHSGMAENARQAVRGPWIEGYSGGAPRWIAATSGLGTGVDVAGIVAVVHVGRPYGLVDFIQQTGRGGRRAGERVQSVVVHDGQAGWVPETEGQVERANREAMQAFLAAAGCRRTVLGVFLDGVAGETCRGLEGAAWCDHCQGSSTTRGTRSGTRSGDESRPTQGGQRHAVDAEADEASDESDESDESGQATQLWTTVGKEEGRREQLVRWWMTEVGEACAACHVTWQQYLELDADQKRQWSQCDGAMRCQTVADISVAEAKKAVVFPELACCYRCKLPLNWCEEQRGAGESECTAEDVVTPVVLLAMDAGWAGRVLESVAGVNLASFTEEAAFFRWLGEARRFHGTRGTNALVLWEALLCAAF